MICCWKVMKIKLEKFHTLSTLFSSETWSGKTKVVTKLPPAGGCLMSEQASTQQPKLNMRNYEEMRSENYAKKWKGRKKLIIGKRFSTNVKRVFIYPRFTFRQKLINGSLLNSHFTALLFFIVISFRFFIFSFQWKIHQLFTLSLASFFSFGSYSFSRADITDMLHSIFWA